MRFISGTNGSITGTNEDVTNVLLGTTIYPSAPTVSANNGYSHTGWNNGYSVNQVIPETVTVVNGIVTIEAQYSTVANISVTHNKPISNTVYNGDELIHSIVITNTGDLAGNISLDLSSNNVAGVIVPGTGFEAITSTNGITNLEIAGHSTVTITYKLNVTGVAHEAIITTLNYTIGTQAEMTDVTTYNLETTITYTAKNQSIKDSNVVIAIDRSGSMTASKFNEAKAAAVAFINNMFAGGGNNNSTVTVYTFGYKCEESWWTGLTCIFNGTDPYAEKIGGQTYNSSNYSTLTGKINALQADGGHWLHGNGTPYTEPLKAANETFNALTNNNNDVLVFLSDGAPNDNTTNWNNQLTALDNSGVNIYSVGYNITAGSAAYNNLAKIASSSDQVFVANTTALTEAFEKISVSITNGNGVTSSTVLGVASIGSSLVISNQHPVIIKYGSKTETVTALGNIVYKAADNNYYINVNNLPNLLAGEAISVEFFANVSN